MRGAILVFLIAYFLNVIPAFAPPTWMVFSFLGFQYPSLNVILLALVGALAATLGRVTLARMSRMVIREKIMSQSSRDNVDAIREQLERSRGLTFGISLFYAFTPFPSNYLFIAYGLTGSSLVLIAFPFFIGRCVSYSFWGFTTSAFLRRLIPESSDAIPYLSLYFISSQSALLYLVYLFTKIDWRFLFDERKLRWMPRHRPSWRPSRTL